MKNKITKLKDLALRSHYYCEDSWYSCPKATDGCIKDNDGECDCGADQHNAKVLKIYTDLMMQLEPKKLENDPEDEPTLLERYFNDLKSQRREWIENDKS